jgi:hypothetical protein
MSTGERRRYTVSDKQGAQWIGSLVATLEPGWSVTIAPPGRSLPQNDIFHSLVDQIAKAVPTYDGKRMTATKWKDLIIISHAIAKREADGEEEAIELVRDLEGSGLVQLRESSARMSKARGSSLIEYTFKTGAELGVQFKETRDDQA